MESGDHIRDRSATMAIGRCEHCGADILAPQDILVWAEDHTFHQPCYQQVVERRIAGTVAV
jgi:hypothetical protein